jgi:hypothetical protein
MLLYYDYLYCYLVRTPKCLGVTLYELNAAVQMKKELLLEARPPGIMSLQRQWKENHWLHYGRTAQPTHAVLVSSPASNLARLRRRA